MAPTVHRKKRRAASGGGEVLGIRVKRPGGELRGRGECAKIKAGSDRFKDTLLHLRREEWATVHSFLICDADNLTVALLGSEGSGGRGLSDEQRVF